MSSITEFPDSEVQSTPIEEFPNDVIAPTGVNLPSQFSSGLPSSVPISDNPDWSFTKGMAAEAEQGFPTFSKPFIPIKSAEVKPDDTKLEAVGKEAYNLAKSIPEFIESPLGVLTAPIAAEAKGAKILAGLFGANTFKDVGKQIIDSNQNWDSYTDSEKAAAITDIVGKSALGAVLTRGAFAKGKPTEVSNAEAIRGNQGQLPEAGQIPQGIQEISGNDLEQAAPGQSESVGARRASVIRQQDQTPPQEVATPTAGDNFQDLRPQEAIDLESENAGNPPTAGSIPISPELESQLNAADITVGSGIKSKILSNRIKSPVALQRVFPNLKLTLTEAQEVLDQVWTESNKSKPRPKNEIPQPETAASVRAEPAANQSALEKPVNELRQQAAETPPENAPQIEPTTGQPIPAVPGVEPIAVAKGIRVEAKDHPEVAAKAPELLPSIVVDELKIDKNAYDGDKDPNPPSEPAKSSSVPIKQPLTREITQPVSAETSPIPSAETASDDPFLSRVANRFTEERSKSGEIGEIAPGQGYSAQDLVNRGLKMKPEEVQKHISDLVNKKGGNPVLQGAAVRAEEARLSKKSIELSKIADANPTDAGARQSADDAFNELTNFHKGPIAQLKTIFHGVGEGLQGEIPVDLSTFNGLREAWLRDNNKPPPPRIEPEMRRTARNVRKAISAERDVTERLGKEIERKTKGKKLPSPEDVRDAIINRMKDMPCRN